MPLKTPAPATPLAKEGLAVLGRSELEAAILKLQEDHARRKEAFDQVCVPWREERREGVGTDRERERD